MNFTQAIKMAFSSILSNKMRSFLTMLGVIIGVTAVITLIALGQGSTQRVSSQIESLGTNLITINITGGRNRGVSEEDLERIKSMPGVSEIAPVLSGGVTVKAGNKNTNSSLEATTPGYQQVRNRHVQLGRFLLQNDLDMRFRVAVVGVDVADELFGRRDIVGEKISINGVEFSIVGILEEKGSSIAGSDDNKVIIPLTTGQRLLRNTEVRTFYVSTQSPDVVNQVVGEIQRFLTRKFNDENSFRVFNQTQLLSTINEATATLTMMLGGIAGISLLVGGIGIMNIMLVSVTERTREIGIRKAIGAKRRDILIQFLIESAVLSGLGGVLGIMLGFVVVGFLSRILSIPATISTGVVLLATGFSVAVGIIFGLYPASKAASLNPIDALRYE
ncbi:ABC transporter permease [Caldicoprobacter faecalis]|uniref:Putative ABC transport system permease protein n=1 Tax=Caldicoprobacter faecalis TaxID=937334 RepID=A0A1I5WZ82_9FIRM|nr:ABC transporter permease [Caldicoprobacter faecalis]SFQ24807.1 putative ABC transport system permease protein [Caldicoprobacter faecalis]